MTSYAISDPNRPWITRFSSARLEAVAEALAAQPQIQQQGIYATLDGLPRTLTVTERIELFQAVLKLRPDNETAAAELAGTQQNRDVESEP
jgi:hypothetical protein